VRFTKNRKPFPDLDVSNVDWDSDGAQESLQKLFVNLVKVLEWQIEIYDWRRRRQIVVSIAARVLAMAALVLGIVFPLIGHVSWGYIFIALAGVAVLADRVFVGSEGNARCAMVQRDLQDLLTGFRIRWLQSRFVLSSATLDNSALKKPIALLLEVEHDCYAIIKAELGLWSASVKSGLDEISNRGRGSDATGSPAVGTGDPTTS
jgi:hypothetical protein